MKKHSLSILKKRDFIMKHKSLSEEMINFYTKLYIAQEKAYDGLPENMEDCFPLNSDNLPFLKTESIRLSEEIISTLSLLVNDIAEIVNSANPGMNFKSIVESFRGIAEEALIKFLEHDFDYFDEKASGYRLDISELIFIIHNTFKPLLIKVRINSRVSVNKEDWLKKECPFCGYMPDFSKIVESKDNLRKLHCSFCEDEWEFPRLKCHSCENSDQKTLGFYEFEDNPDYRVYYCDKCKNYIKSVRIPKLNEESGYDLTVEDIATGFLDSTMISKNYNRS
jgi:formate dehydrogenase maturation protein FdhE